MSSFSPSPSGPEGTALFLFENSHQALWAETVAQERDIPVHVVPAPTTQVASCGLALQVSAAHVAELEGAFQNEGIAFQFQK
jgi:hypothetical protein